MVIFAPNHMFLDYISDVLPELGVGNIQQSTFADWALDLLGLDLPLADPAETLSYWFESGSLRKESMDEAPGRFKGSVHFMELLQAFVERLEPISVPEGDFSPWMERCCHKLRF